MRIANPLCGITLLLAAGVSRATDLEISRVPLLAGCGAGDAAAAASLVSLTPPAVGGGAGAGLRLYQAGFRRSDWSGYLHAYAVGADGHLEPVTDAWAAAAFDPGPENRRIVTLAASAGRPLRWDELGAAQREALHAGASVPGSAAEVEGRRRLAWLRGDHAGEGAEPGALRPRATVLGDIVHSAPAYVAAPSAPYPDDWGAGAPENRAPYSDFRTARRERPPLLFVGANDGMLHAFDAAAGTEVFAYVPRAAFPRLAELTDPSYRHRFTVDGSPVVMDAFFDDTNTGWRSVLAGGLGAGGQALYALDVTDPPDATATEHDVANRVLWEFADVDDADLGYSFGTPNIVRLANGEWAVVAGNGYGNTQPDAHVSTSGSAVLFVIDVESGGLIAKLDTLEGSAADPAGLGRPNGLSTPAPVDRDGDYVIDVVFAGDLFGNLWKFDLTSPNPAEWHVAHDGYTSDPQPFFRARHDPTDPATAQPITVRPQVVRHPVHADDLLVVFGTGKYFEVGDGAPGDRATQTVYGLRDRGAGHDPGLTRRHLLRQAVVGEVADAAGGTSRVTTDRGLTWFDGAGLPANAAACTDRDPADDLPDGCAWLGWHLDLPGPGERLVSDLSIRGERLVFTTLQPNGDTCDTGGGWHMELDLATGARPARTPFDFNADGVFSTADMPDVDGDGTPDVTLTGRRSAVGVASPLAILNSLPPSGAGAPSADGGADDGGAPVPGECVEYRYAAGADGKPEPVIGRCGRHGPGRRSWQELL